ncbi:peptidylprolyl isomerase [Acetobacteraceae bacterium KSS8]|uniref:Parvulin-like PPIase n=1 Tax=Endosaccharibacter trunci TaxID=2812733 RepID=A0ABT1W8E2_9PROT|nr:peptidylprolyl isomerase [Acetobacteraceae bacterium KSS8]
MRRSSPAALFSAAAFFLSASALTPAAFAAPHKKDAVAADAKPAAAPAAPKDNNPVVASVNGQPIHLDDVRAAAQALPEDMRSVPPQMLFPMLVNQLIDQKALVIAAKKEGLEKDPAAQKAMQAAADQALQNVYLSRIVGPQADDAAVKDVYARDYAGKPGEEEIHARHILVADEKTAQDIIKQLKAGADFATLAKKYSTDKASVDAGGGDLGWFKKGDMLPEFSNAAFAMKKGEISDKPVHTRYGWHVIQVLDTRISPPPAFDTVAAQIRQKLIQTGVHAAVDKAVAQVKVQRFNPDGTPASDKPAPASSAPAGSSPVPAQAAAPTTPGTTPPNGN